MSGSDLVALADELCRVFVGWKLGQDEDALLELGEGALRIDVRSGECWCDDAPLPPLFIASELQALLERHQGRPEAAPIDSATLEALFETRRIWRRGGEAPTLEITCRTRLESAGAAASGEARRQASPA